MLQKLILIAEDNDDARYVFSAILHFDGYRIVEATNGSDAVARAQEHAPDLIITDINMPVMDGFEAARLLRAGGSTAGIPILAITGTQFSAEQQAEAEDLFDGCFAKPMQPSRVLAEVQRLIGPPDR